MRSNLRNTIIAQADKLDAMAAAWSKEAKWELLGLHATVFPATFYFTAIGALPIIQGVKNSAYTQLSWAGNVTRTQCTLLRELATKLREIASEGAESQVFELNDMQPEDDNITAIEQANSAINATILQLVTALEQKTRHGKEKGDDGTISTRAPLIAEVNVMRSEIITQAKDASELASVATIFKTVFVEQVKAELAVVVQRYSIVDGREMDHRAAVKSDTAKVIKNMDETTKVFDSLLAKLGNRGAPAPAAAPVSEPS